MSWLRNPAIAVSVGFAVLTTAWAVTTPPFASPDEWSHYLRTLSISHGQVLGRPITDYPPGLTQAQLTWVLQATRVVEFPPGFAPEGYACHVFTPKQSAACNDAVRTPPEGGERIIPNGTYQPAAYLPAATLIRLGWGPKSALLFGRLATAAACALLLFVAARALLAGANRAVFALLLACTPMTVFLSGMLNPSGLEIFGAIALLSGLLAVDRGGDAAKPGWLAATVGAVVLPLSRSLGGAYLPAVIALWCFAAGPRRVLQLARAFRKQTVIFTLAAALGFVINRAWEHLYGPRVPADTHDLGSALVGALGQFPGWLKQQLGNFQYIDTPLPEPVYAAWFAVAAALIALGVALGSQMHRRGIAAGVLLAFAIPLALQVLVLRPSEWLVQGRHIIAVTVPALLFAGDSLARSTRGSVPMRALQGAVIFVWPAGHVSGFWVNAHRSAVGLDGPWWFLGGSEWQPRLGWVLWLVVALAAVALVVAAGVSSMRSPGLRADVAVPESESTQHV